jgi:hypothetical protein
MNDVLLTRFFSGGSLRIHNEWLTESRADRFTATRLAGQEAFVAAVVQHFGMSAELVRQAIADLDLPRAGGGGHR